MCSQAAGAWHDGNAGGEGARKEDQIETFLAMKFTTRIFSITSKDRAV